MSVYPPRRTRLQDEKPKPPSKIKTYIVGGVAVAAVVLAGYVIYTQFFANSKPGARPAADTGPRDQYTGVPAEALQRMADQGLIPEADLERLRSEGRLTAGGSNETASRSAAMANARPQGGGRPGAAAPPAPAAPAALDPMAIVNQLQAIVDEGGHIRLGAYSDLTQQLADMMTSQAPPGALGDIIRASADLNRQMLPVAYAYEEAWAGIGPPSEFQPQIYLTADEIDLALAGVASAIGAATAVKEANNQSLAQMQQMISELNVTPDVRPIVDATSAQVANQVAAQNEYFTLDEEIGVVMLDLLTLLRDQLGEWAPDGDEVLFVDADAGAQFQELTSLLSTLAQQQETTMRQVFRVQP